MRFVYIGSLNSHGKMMKMLFALSLRNTLLLDSSQVTGDCNHFAEHVIQYLNFHAF